MASGPFSGIQNLIKGVSDQGLVTSPARVEEDVFGNTLTYIRNFRNRLPTPITDEASSNTLLMRQQIAQNAQSRKPTALSQYAVSREPWVFTTFASINRINNSFGANQSSVDTLTDLQNSGGINQDAQRLFWIANPMSVSWSISQRATEEKNKSGTVLHVWRDRSRNTDYDNPKITMQFNSGSIHPIEDETTGLVTGKKISGGLTNFYQFLSLVDQPKIVGGLPNTIHILYRSPIFPSLLITGFFDPQMVVQFSDSTDNPFKVNSWQASFTIYDTFPRLKDFAQLRSAFEADGLVLPQARPTPPTEKRTTQAEVANPPQGGVNGLTNTLTPGN